MWNLINRSLSNEALQIFYEVRGRPALTFTTEAKLSSKIIMSELSFATSVPWMPIARPMSA